LGISTSNSLSVWECTSVAVKSSFDSMQLAVIFRVRDRDGWLRITILKIASAYYATSHLCCNCGTLLAELSFVSFVFRDDIRAWSRVSLQLIYRCFILPCHSPRGNYVYDCTTIDNSL
jgi:hypothetical protein